MSDCASNPVWLQEAAEAELSPRVAERADAELLKIAPNPYPEGVQRERSRWAALRRLYAARLIWA
jgi:hypothetical protein